MGSCISKPNPPHKNELRDKKKKKNPPKSKTLEKLSEEETFLINSTKLPTHSVLSDDVFRRSTICSEVTRFDKNTAEFNKLDDCDVFYDHNRSVISEPRPASRQQKREVGADVIHGKIIRIDGPDEIFVNSENSCPEFLYLGEDNIRLNKTELYEGLEVSFVRGGSATQSPARIIQVHNHKDEIGNTRNLTNCTKNESKNDTTTFNTTSDDTRNMMNSMENFNGIVRLNETSEINDSCFSIQKRDSDDLDKYFSSKTEQQIFKKKNLESSTEIVCDNTLHLNPEQTPTSGRKFTNFRQIRKKSENEDNLPVCQIRSNMVNSFEQSTLQKTTSSSQKTIDFLRHLERDLKDDDKKLGEKARPLSIYSKHFSDANAVSLASTKSQFSVENMLNADKNFQNQENVKKHEKIESSTSGIGRESFTIYVDKEDIYEGKHNKDQNNNLTVNEPEDARSLKFKIEEFIHDLDTQKQKLDSIKQDPNLSRLLFDQTHASKVELPDNSCFQGFNQTYNQTFNQTFNSTFDELEASLNGSHLSDNDIDLKEKIQNLKSLFQDLQQKNDHNQQQIRCLQKSIVAVAETSFDKSLSLEESPDFECDAVSGKSQEKSLLLEKSRVRTHLKFNETDPYQTGLNATDLNETHTKNEFYNENMSESDLELETKVTELLDFTANTDSENINEQFKYAKFDDMGKCESISFSMSPSAKNSRNDSNVNTNAENIYEQFDNTGSSESFSFSFSPPGQIRKK